METTLYELTMKDGRKFRISAENKHQKNRVLKTFRELGYNNKLECISNGIHTVKQFENIMSAERN